MRICTFTTIIGPDTDPLLSPVTLAAEVDYFCFTDQPIESDAWNIVKVETQGHPCHQSRRIKILAEEVWHEYDVSLWIDAAFELMADPRQMAERWLWRNDMMALRHPDRTSLIDEGKEIVRLKKAPEENVQKQIVAYRAFAANQKQITSTGLCLRRHSPRVKNFSKAWWREFEAHGHYRDQMSIDYCLWRCAVDVQYLSGHYRDNPYAKWHPPQSLSLRRRALAL